MHDSEGVNAVSVGLLKRTVSTGKKRGGGGEMLVSTSETDLCVYGEMGWRNEEGVYSGEGVCQLHGFQFG